MARIGLWPRVSGLSWLGVVSMVNVPSGNLTSQAQPLPKTLKAAAVSLSWKVASDPNLASIALASSPLGAAPPLPKVGHQKEWFAWPPPLLRTAVRADSGQAFRFSTSSQTVFPASSGCAATAIFRLFTSHGTKHTKER